MNLGRIEKVDIRSQWANEEYNFTPWLAKEPNIQILADEIGLDLEVEDTEVYIGSYKADIVAVDGDSRKVIIENQLSKTSAIRDRHRIKTYDKKISHAGALMMFVQIKHTEVYF